MDILTMILAYLTSLVLLGAGLVLLKVMVWLSKEKNKSYHSKNYVIVEQLLKEHYDKENKGKDTDRDTKDSGKARLFM